MGEPLILHYDGTSFTEVPIPAEENVRNATTMFKVWGIGGSVFIVGQNGEINRWDGERWVFTSPGADASQDFVSLWGTSEDHIVAVGGRGNAQLATWDGSAWTTLKPTGVGGLNGVTLLDPDTAIVGGVNGFVGSFQPSTGTLTEEARPTTLDVHAVWSDGAGTAYAVAGHFLPPYDGAAFVRRED
ncbi:MAG: hypothetical protein R3F59_08500 [Myxococcota bacterium]